MEDKVKVPSFDIINMVVQFARRNSTVSQLKFISEDEDGVRITRIGEMAVINYLYRVQSADGLHSLVVKYGEERAAAIDNESYPLERQELEYSSLLMVNDLCPGSVPEPYHFDRNLHMIAMEDLSHMDLFGLTFKQGEIDPVLTGRIGEIIGTLQVSTHKQLLTPQVWAEYKKTLTNDAIRDQVLHYRFTCVLQEIDLCVPSTCTDFFHKCLGEIVSNRIFDEIKSLYHREDCFIHADPHLYTFLYSKDRSVVIDFEFGSLGNHAFTMGFLSAHCLMCMKEAESNSKKNLSQITRTALEAMYDAFFEAFGNNVGVLGPKENFISEIAAFSGQTLFTYPLANGIENLVVMTPDQKYEAVQTGYELMLSYKDIKDIKPFLDVLFKHHE